MPVSQLHQFSAISAIVDRLAAASGFPVWPVSDADDHEVYLKRPEVLAAAVRSTQSNRWRRRALGESELPLQADVEWVTARVQQHAPL